MQAGRGWWTLVVITVHIHGLCRTIDCEEGTNSLQVDIPFGRIRRQIPSMLLAPNNDKPPSFVHPSCRPFGGVCAGVEYRIDLQPGIVPGIQPLKVLPKAIEAKDLEYAKAITYKFINGTPTDYEGYFFMDPSSAAISQVRPIPFGEVDNYVMYFMAQEAGPQGLYSVAKLTVRVDNGAKNLHNPVLEASGLRGYIEENAEIGTTVRIEPQPDAAPLQILVTDEDLLPGAPPATYQYILMGIGASVFAVNQGGYVYLNAPNLDADGASPKTYALTIQAREVGTAPIRSSEPISIKIDMVGVNDNEPGFDRQVYQATAVADVAMQDILKIEARDADSGKFGELRYGIVSVTNNGEKAFRYNTDTHSLVSMSPLAAGEQYQVLLQATDGGGRSAQVIVVVDVVSSTTRLVTTTTAPATTRKTVPAPAFSPLPEVVSATVSESATIGDTVVVLRDNNADKLRYKLVKGNEENKFRLDPESGAISISSPLDREATSAYNLTVQATGSTVNGTVTVIINVSDENDHGPIIMNPKPIVFTVEDGSPANTVVGRIHVEDADAGQNGAVKLSIDRNSPSASLFTLDPSDGTLRTRGTLKASGKSIYHLRIVARDGAASPRESVEEVEIRVIDKSNLLPIFANDNYVIEIDENVGPRELVTVRATSPFADSPVTYVLRQGDPTLFAVDAKAGTVSTLSNLDAEQRRAHSLIVGTKENEGKGPGTVANIEVRVKDTNDWIPMFQPQSYAATILDSVQVGAPILQVTAIDQDTEEPNNALRYRLLGDNNATYFFAIDPPSGIITVKRPLTAAKHNGITLSVEARDSGSPPLSSTATAVVQLQRSPLPLISAAEPAITSPNVVPTTSSTVQVTTDAPSRADVRFSSAQYSSSVTEGAATGFVFVLPVLNKPPDLQGLQCSIVSGNYGGVFAIIANGEGDCKLTLRGLIDHTTVDRYALNVSVSAPRKGGSLINYAQVLVDVLATHDNGRLHFLFDPDSNGTYFAALAPDKPPFTRVITVQAVDGDGGRHNEVTYSLDSSSPDSQYFVINSDTGELKNAQLLPDRSQESQPYFQFAVEARGNTASGQAMVSKADVVVNLITDSNRFVMTLVNTQPSMVDRYIPDMKRSMRSGVGECKALGVESVTDSSDLGTDIVWFAVNPVTKRICTHDQFHMLFDRTHVDRIKEELSGRVNVRQLRPAVADSSDQILSAGVASAGEEITGGLFSYNRWQAAEIALVVLACVIVLGAIVGLLAICYFWSKRKESRIAPADRVQLYTAVPKYNALMLPPSEKEYETQIMEMAVPAERAMGKIGAADFGVGEGVYSMQTSGNFDVYTQRQPPPHVYIPPPDYPSNGINHHVFSNFGIPSMEITGRHSAVPAPAKRKRNGEKTTIL